MYLKALTMRGFKSFASATTLKFEPGITCVVGPNGSGKSNIVDALTWVMGEQGAKSLRGANMADVIFAGTNTRTALGRAQVELTIDNSDGRLPIEYSEVTITRTLFRGGGSEYTINGAPTRLLDVQELLSDSGMGKQMHVIVGQGQLDAVLRATAEERREFIDEAAGVLKHRKRKERALRKLSAMDADLLRVVDLNDEIKRQLRPLARQAKAAKAAEGIYERIRHAQKLLLADSLLQARTLLEKQKREGEELQERKTAAANDLAEYEKTLRLAEQDAQNLGTTLAQITELSHQFESLTERLTTVKAVVTERLGQAQRSPGGPAQAAVLLAVEKFDESQSEVEQHSRRVETLRAEMLDKAGETEAAQRHLEEAEKTLTDAALSHERTLEEKSRERELLSKARAQLEAALSTLEASNGRRELAKTQLEEAEAAAESFAGGGESGVEMLQARHEACVKTVEARADAVERARLEQTDREAELAKWEARADALRQALLVEDTGEKQPFGSGPPLNQLLQVKRGWERAIAALLGDYESAAVCSDEEWEPALKAAGKNRFAAVVESGTNNDNAGSKVSDPLARGIVTADPRVEGAVQDLLAGSSVATDVTEALRLLAKTRTLDRVALPDGTVIGRFRAKNPLGESAPPLLLRGQQEEAESNANELKLENERALARIQNLRDGLAEATRAADEALSALRSAEQAAARHEQQRVAHQQRAEEATGRFETARQEVETAEERVHQARNKVAELARLEAVPANEWSPEKIDELRDRVNAATLKARSAREEQMAAKLQVSLGEEQLRNLIRQSEALRARADQLRFDHDDAKEKERLLSEKALHLQGILERAEVALEESRARADATRERRTRLEAQSRAAHQEAQRLQGSVEKLRWAQMGATEQWQQVEVAVAGAQMSVDQAYAEMVQFVEETGDSPGEEAEPNHTSLRVEELLEEFGSHLQIAAHDGEPRPYVRTEVESELKAARAELNKLGVVNPLAMTEYEALEARHSFLTEQLGDLKQSKQDLLDIIEDVDVRIEEAFSEAFADTQAEFARVFPALFPGGTGKLSLTDPESPLTTGVEIYARPAGKRVTRLSLLSGGERSLAALAYLVAIFRARPSPFYVLDEVEAALDDVNLTRVLGVLEELRAGSQLIVITHQQRTMEIADALYGVTMAKGESTVISHRM